MANRSNKKAVLLWILLILMFLAIYRILGEPQDGLAPVMFSTMIQQIESGDVEHVSVRIVGTGPAADFSGRLHDGTRFRSSGVFSDKLINLLDAQHQSFDVSRDPDQAWTTIISTWVPVLLLLAVFVLLFRKATSSSASIGDIAKSPAKRVDPAKNPAHWADVIGAEDAKRALQDLIAGLKTKTTDSRLLRPPARVLLIGPPGNGKTLLARAAASESKLPFFTVSAAELIHMFVGIGAARIKAVFEEVQRAAPAILFIDDLDAIARRRDTEPQARSDEREQTLIQLLSTLDGFDPITASIGVIAASNRPDLLDEAVLRSGRFDRVVRVPPPDAEARRLIVERHSTKLASDVDLTLFIRDTEALGAADLIGLLTEAARTSGGGPIRAADLDAARKMLVRPAPVSQPAAVRMDAGT